jgi:isoleucyl-tRNA synthetase
VNKYGADALRLYLINSPVVKAESLRFKEEGVKDILKDVFLPWYNAYRFLLQNIETYKDANGVSFHWCEVTSYGQSDNVMDKWIISFTQSLLLFVKREMAAYRLYTVLPRLMKFIDNLTNWYVRTNRKRLKGEGNTKEDCRAALDTLFSVLFTIVRVFAPFTPFLTEHMYQNMKGLVDWSKDDTTKSDKERASVHYLMIPQPRDDLINEGIERSVARMQSVIELGRVLRDRKTMPVKYPLPEVVLIHKDQECLDDVASLQVRIKNPNSGVARIFVYK